MALAEVKERIWRYLDGCAKVEQLGSVASGLLDIDRAELDRLIAAHVMLSDEVRAMLDAVARLLRELPSSAIRSEDETVGYVRMPIDWAATLRRRTQSGDPRRFVCRPAERRYDTPAARATRLALDLCQAAGISAAMAGKGPVAQSILRRRTRAERLSHHAKITDIPVPTTVARRTLDRLRARPHTTAIADFIEVATAALRERRMDIVREVIETMVIAPSANDRLFELQVGFGLVAAIEHIGFIARPLHLIYAAGQPFAVLDRGQTTLWIWYQRPLWLLPPFKRLASQGAYVTALRAAHLRPAYTRPDFLIHAEKEGLVCIVEAKLTEREGESRDRAGLVDAMGYLHDGAAALDGMPPPRALVVAWGSDAEPNLDDVLITGLDSLGCAVDVLLSAWLTPPASVA